MKAWNLKTNKNWNKGETGRGETGRGETEKHVRQAFLWCAGNEQVREFRCTSDGSRWRVVLGEGETAAGQDVLLLQVFEFQDVDLTFDCRRRTESELSCFHVKCDHNILKTFFHNRFKSCCLHMQPSQSNMNLHVDSVSIHHCPSCSSEGNICISNAKFELKICWKKKINTIISFIIFSMVMSSSTRGQSIPQ